MKRIFTAIKINPDDQFVDIYEELKSACLFDKIKWVELYNIHITLKFFGETEESRIKGIRELLTEISKNHSSFSMNIKDVGIFGSSYNPRVIWFGFDKSEKLINLANDVLDQVESLGYERGRQNFVPHITIGRIKHVDDKKRFQEVIDQFKTAKIQNQKVNQFYLIESNLTPKGPEYNILQTFPLQ
jgi:2'-5' RNA ligase